MADTTFVPRVTTIVSTWLQAINDRIFKGRSPNFATTTGSANAQVLTLATGSLYIGATDGDTFQFVAGFTNTGATTLQVIQPSGVLAAVALQVAGQACVGGELIAGQPYFVVRLGSTWQLFPNGGFLQSGTGAIARTVQAKGRDIVSIKDFGVTGDGTDETTKWQAAIDKLIADGAGGLYLPPPSVDYAFGDLSIARTASFNGFFSIIGGHVGTKARYIGSGTAFSIAGTVGDRLSRLSLENMDLSANTRRAGTGILLDYADTVVLRGVWLRKFATGFLATNTTGIKLYDYHTVDNALGTHLSTLSGGGFTWFGGTADSDQLGLDINTNSSGIRVLGVEFDTDAYSLNGANSQGAWRVQGSAARVTFENCNHTAQATPTFGATALADGSSADIVLINPFFDGGSASQAALKIANSSGITWIQGRTTGHTSSSIIESGAGGGSSVFFNPNFAESTKFSGAGAANCVWLNFAAGVMQVRLGRSIRWYASDDSANVGLAYSSGYLATSDDMNLAGAAKIAGSGKGLGFYGTSPVALQTGVAVSAAGIHAALVNLGLITA